MSDNKQVGRRGFKWTAASGTKDGYLTIEVGGRTVVSLWGTKGVSDTTLNAVGAKPSIDTTGGTADCVGFESSPRFQDACGGRDIIGFKSNPDLKGTTGNLTGSMRCYEGKLESESGSTRTVALGTVLHAMNALHGTVTLGPYVIAVDAAGGNVAWKGFLRAAASGAGGVTTGNMAYGKTATDNDEDGYITIYIGSTEYQIPFYAAAS